MLPADYIQWKLDNNEMKEISAPFDNYIKSKKNIINKARVNRYSSIIKAKFNGNEKNIEQYFNLIHSIIGNESFQGAVNIAVDKLAFPSMTNMQLKYVGRIQELLKNNVDTFQNLVSEVDAAVQGIVSALGLMDLDAAISPEANKAIQQIFNDNPNKSKLVKLKQYQELDNTAAGQYRYLLSLMPDFQNILANRSQAGSDASIKILSQLLVPIQTLIGFCSEFQIDHEVEKILDQMQKELGRSGMTISRVGGEGSSTGGYKIGTSDLTITLGDNGHVSMGLPNLGMSLKRTSKNINKADGVNIKLKGSTYGKLLRDIDPSLLTAFYTIYAYTNPENNGDVPGDTLSGAYKLMKMEASISALIGNIDADDLVFVLVVNNKSITIFDLLESMSESNNDPFTLSPAFKSARPGLIAQHKKLYTKNPAKANERSEKLRNYITNKMSASVSVKLSRAQLDRFK